MEISSGFILSVAPSARPEIVAGIVAAAPGLLKRYGIRDIDIPYLFGQMATETGGFNRLEENLFYTSTARLRQVWPGRFTSDATARPYVRNPQGLANLVYGGRLGNNSFNDGWQFRGSSDIQTTGRVNFQAVAYGSGLKCMENPELLRAHPGALEAACLFWRDHSLGRFADRGDIIGLTRAINGGLTNLADRKVFTDRALRALANSVEPVSADGWLRRGSLDVGHVKSLQLQLQSRGYYKGGLIDGDFSAGTEDALRHFQTDRGLVSDGVVGPATQRALNADIPAVASDPYQNPIDPALPAVAPAKGLVARLRAMLDGSTGG